MWRLSRAIPPPRARPCPSLRQVDARRLSCLLLQHHTSQRNKNVGSAAPLVGSGVAGGIFILQRRNLHTTTARCGWGAHNLQETEPHHLPISFQSSSVPIPSPLSNTQGSGRTTDRARSRLDPLTSMCRTISQAAAAALFLSVPASSFSALSTKPVRERALASSSSPASIFFRPQARVQQTLKQTRTTPPQSEFHTSVCVVSTSSANLTRAVSVARGLTLLLQLCRHMHTHK